MFGNYIYKSVVMSIKASKKIKKSKPKKIKVLKLKPVKLRDLAKQSGFRSGLELHVHEQLTENKISYSYESEKIEYIVPAHSSKYTPDFIFTKLDGTKMYIESKGRFLASDRKKHLLIKSQHPELDIRILFQNANNKLSKSSKTTYAAWCEKNNIRYGEFPIPSDWLKEISR